MHHQNKRDTIVLERTPHVRGCGKRTHQWYAGAQQLLLSESARWPTAVTQCVHVSRSHDGPNVAVIFMMFCSCCANSTWVSGTKLCESNVPDTLQTHCTAAAELKTACPYIYDYVVNIGTWTAEYFGFRTTLHNDWTSLRHWHLRGLVVALIVTTTTVDVKAAQHQCNKKNHMSVLFAITK